MLQGSDAVDEDEPALWDILGADIGAADETLQLRAERAGVGFDRVYTLTYEAEDEAGNVPTETVQVRVEHDRGRRRR